jgi:hypothetical protein
MTRVTRMLRRLRLGVEGWPGGMEGRESAGTVRGTDFSGWLRFRVGGWARIGYSSDATPERSGGPARDDPDWRADVAQW